MPSNCCMLFPYPAPPMQWIADRFSRRGKTDEPVYLAIKYTVPPSVQDDFIDEWWVAEGVG